MQQAQRLSISAEPLAVRKRVVLDAAGPQLQQDQVAQGERDADQDHSGVQRGLLAVQLHSEGGHGRHEPHHVHDPERGAHQSQRVLAAQPGQARRGVDPSALPDEH